MSRRSDRLTNRIRASEQTTSAALTKPLARGDRTARSAPPPLWSGPHCTTGAIADNEAHAPGHAPCPGRGPRQRGQVEDVLWKGNPMTLKAASSSLIVAATCLLIGLGTAETVNARPQTNQAEKKAQAEKAQA